jgi:hypothetical protein
MFENKRGVPHHIPEWMSFMSTLPIYVWAIVLVGLIGTTTTICVLLFRGALAAGFSRRVGTTMAVVAGTAWATWVLASAALAYANVYRFAPAKAQPWLPAAMTVAIAAGLLASRMPAVSRILGQPDALWRMTVPQIFRVEGVTFLIVMALGKLPAVFALPAGLGDIAIGFEAIYIARSLQRGVVGRRAVWFNILGLLDLAVATIIGVTAAPGVAHVLSLSPSTEQIALLPVVLIPTTVVPLAVALHVLSLRELAMTRKLAVSNGSSSIPTPAGA